MVVNILVYIEGRKDVERVAEVSFPGNGRITSEDWEKVCGTNYGVKMDDRHHPIPVNIKIGFNDPHAVVRIRVIKGFAKVMDKCARKEFIPDLKREK